MDAENASSQRTMLIVGGIAVALFALGAFYYVYHYEGYHVQVIAGTAAPVQQQTVAVATTAATTSAPAKTTAPMAKTMVSTGDSNAANLIK